MYTDLGIIIGKILVTQEKLMGEAPLPGTTVGLYKPSTKGQQCALTENSVYTFFYDSTLTYFASIQTPQVWKRQAGLWLEQDKHVEALREKELRGKVRTT